jgi:hypothetical protein
MINHAVTALIVPIASATVGAIPQTLPTVHIHGAHRSAYSEPGLLTLIPSASEADVQEPSSG